MENNHFNVDFSIIQRYLINTIFDTINSLMGVILGLYLSGEPSNYTIAISAITTAVALGISSGTSTYEAEYLDQVTKIKEIEEHLMQKFPEDSEAYKNAKKAGVLVGLSNFLTPVTIAILTATIILAIHPLLVAIISGIIFLIISLFFAGIYFGIINKMNPWKRGIRMLLIGTFTFTVVYILGSLI
jgi:predicted membrane protein (TIGR00267 family)